MPVSAAFSRSRGGRRWLAWLFWAGVGLAPAAALLLVAGQGAGPLRAAAVLAILAVVFIGLSVVFREDPADIREDLTDQVRREVDLVRREIGSVHRVVEAQLRHEIESVRGELEAARREAVRRTETLSLHSERLTSTGELSGSTMRYIREISSERAPVEAPAPPVTQRSATVYASSSRREKAPDPLPSEEVEALATGRDGPNQDAVLPPAPPDLEVPPSLLPPGEPPAWTPPAWDEPLPPAPLLPSPAASAAAGPRRERHLVPPRPTDRFNSSHGENRDQGRENRDQSRENRDQSRENRDQSRENRDPGPRASDRTTTSVSPPPPASRAADETSAWSFVVPPLPNYELPSIDHLPEPEPQGRHARRSGGRHSAPDR